MYRASISFWSSLRKALMVLKRYAYKRSLLKRLLIFLVYHDDGWYQSTSGWTKIEAERKGGGTRTNRRVSRMVGKGNPTIRGAPTSLIYPRDCGWTRTNIGPMTSPSATSVVLTSSAHLGRQRAPVTRFLQLKDQPSMLHTTYLAFGGRVPCGEKPGPTVRARDRRSSTP